ncbi:glycosyl transferase family 2 [Leptospira ellinghausenii]|uniref:Glycosyl transferase family 2 n=2 Tax=Leptospira ellinghausenii TaxID=1917822 RepID=A0A2P2D9P0_9LEPT|nr:glycosyl transferase family 2 [Leptospira ellinghausenii]
MNCYNGEAYLQEAIDSILNQTYPYWELIFWDNQSTDDSSKIVKSYDDTRIKYYYSPIHTKLYGARNLALEKATGRYIAFLDTDDIWLPEKLEKQLNALKQTGYSFACSNYDLIDSKSRKLKKAIRFNKASGFITEKLVSDYYLGILTVIFEKSILTTTKLRFNENYDHIGDFDLFLKISEEYEIHYDSSSLASYRIHGNNLSSKKQLELLRELSVMIRELEKRLFYSDKLKLILALKQLRTFMFLKIAMHSRKKIFPALMLKFIYLDPLKFLKLLILTIMCL